MLAGYRLEISVARELPRSGPLRKVCTPLEFFLVRGCDVRGRVVAQFTISCRGTRQWHVLCEERPRWHDVAYFG